MSARKAAEKLAELVAANPTDLRLLQKWGEACQRAGDDTTAAEAFSRVAHCYSRDGFFLKAVALLKQVEKLDPTRTDTNFKLVDLHLQLGLMREAIAYFRIAIERAHLRVDRASFLAMAEKLLSADPDAPQWHLYSAQVLLTANRKEEARSSLTKAEVLLRPDHPDLAEAVARIVLVDGSDETRSESDAVRAVRLELFTRVNAEHELRSLDFKFPN